LWTAFAQRRGVDKKKTGVFAGRKESPDEDKYGDSGLDETESRMTAREKRTNTGILRSAQAGFFN
jgi:hypothetical protein